MKKLSILIMACIFIQSCSRIDLAVSLAGPYVTNKADDYFDLNQEQAKAFRKNFDKNFLQVQKVIFPQLATELVKASQAISEKKPLDVTTVSMSYERVKNLFYAGLRIFSTDASVFADNLKPEQVAHFQKEFNKKMRDLKEDENSKEAYKKMKKQFDSWMGTMASHQKKELENFLKTNPPVTSEKIYNRQLLAHEFAAAYPNNVQRKAFVEKLFKNYEQMYEARFSKLAKERNNKVVGIVTDILNKMSSDQRNTLVETLRDRANQLVKISKG